MAELGHAAGLSGEDVGLNRFDPSHFFILGGNLADGPPREGVWSSERIRVNAAVRGQPSLVRLLNLNYFPVVMTFENGARTRALPIAELIAHDGRAYRDTSSRSGSCPPVRARGRGHRMMTNRIAFGAAERYDVLVHTAGRYTLRVDFHHGSPSGNGTAPAPSSLGSSRRGSSKSKPEEGDQPARMTPTDSRTKPGKTAAGLAPNRDETTSESTER